LAWICARGASKYLGSLLISVTVVASNFKFISHAQNKVSTAIEGPTKKVGGPENLVRGPGNFIVPPPFNFYFNPWEKPH